MAVDLAPLVAWPELSERMVWHQGEHVSLIGPTGTGKTTLAIELLGRRRYVAVVGTKPRDKVLNRLKRAGWPVVRALPTGYALDQRPRVIVWPRYRSLDDRVAQRSELRGALLDAFDSGGWTIFADEVHYLSRELGLGDELRQLWTMGRELNVTLVAATQRPAHVPLDMFAQPTHLFLWRTSNDVDLRRLGELGTVDARTVRAVVKSLDRQSHQFLYLHAGTGAMYRSVLPKPGG